VIPQTETCFNEIDDCDGQANESGPGCVCMPNAVDACYDGDPLEYTNGGYNSYTNDASLLQPVNAWTGNYMVESYGHWVYNGFTVPGLYAVTASQDSTQVTLRSIGYVGHDCQA